MGVNRVHRCARAVVAALSLGVAMGCASPEAETSDSQSRKTRPADSGESQRQNREPDYDHTVDWAGLEPLILLEQTRVEVETHLAWGRQFLHFSRYWGAEDEFLEAVEKAKRYPEDANLHSMGEEAKELAAKARKLQAVQEGLRSGDELK